jgi:hypothetical protein
MKLWFGVREFPEWLAVLTVHGRPSALKLLLFAFVYYISG